MTTFSFSNKSIFGFWFLFQFSFFIPSLIKVKALPVTKFNKVQWNWALVGKSTKKDFQNKELTPCCQVKLYLILSRKLVGFSIQWIHHCTPNDKIRMPGFGEKMVGIRDWTESAMLIATQPPPKPWLVTKLAEASLDVMALSRTSSADLWSIRATRRFRFRLREPEEKEQNRFRPVRNWLPPWSGSSTCSSGSGTTRLSWTRSSRARGSIPGSSSGFPPGPGSVWCGLILSRRAVVAVAAAELAAAAAAGSCLTPEVAAGILTKSSNPCRTRNFFTEVRNRNKSDFDFKTKLIV